MQQRAKRASACRDAARAPDDDPASATPVAPEIRPQIALRRGPRGARSLVDDAELAARLERQADRIEARLWRAYGTARRRLDSERPARLGAVATGPSLAAARCDAARNALVEHYQPLVRSVASALERRLPRSVERGDLETAGTVGLMSAIEAFDPTRGVPFELYAEHRLRGALLDELRNLDWLPRPWRARIEARRRALERLRADLGREPWDEEVANALSIPVAQYRQDYGPGLVEGPVTPTWGDESGSGASSTLECVPDEGREAPEERPTRDDLLRLVARKLTAQQYRVVYLRYWEEMPLREIGDVLGLSESRVCKIHHALLGQLREELASDPRDR